MGVLLNRNDAAIVQQVGHIAADIVGDGLSRAARQDVAVRVQHRSLEPHRVIATVVDDEEDEFAVRRNIPLFGTRLRHPSLQPQLRQPHQLLRRERRLLEAGAYAAVGCEFHQLVGGGRVGGPGG
jgi:hypothetical protein